MPLADAASFYPRFERLIASGSDLANAIALLGFQRCAVNLLTDIVHSVVLKLGPLPASSPASCVLDELDKVLAVDTATPDSIHDIAGRLGYSPSHFSRLVRKLTGCSPKRYLMQQRIKQACRLLGDSTLSVREIGARIGYPETRHFSALFKREVGRSPREWRRHQQRLLVPMDESTTETLSIAEQHRLA